MTTWLLSILIIIYSSSYAWAEKNWDFSNLLSTTQDVVSNETLNIDVDYVLNEPLYGRPTNAETQLILGIESDGTRKVCITSEPGNAPNGGHVVNTVQGIATLQAPSTIGTHNVWVKRVSLSDCTAALSSTTSGQNAFILNVNTEACEEKPNEWGAHWPQTNWGVDVPIDADLGYPAPPPVGANARCLAGRVTPTYAQITRSCTSAGWSNTLTVTWPGGATTMTQNVCYPGAITWAAPAGGNPYSYVMSVFEID